MKESDELDSLWLIEVCLVLNYNVEMASSFELGLIYMPVIGRDKPFLGAHYHHGCMGTLGSLCNILKLCLMVSN
jgi:hypothetical protein